MSRVLRQQIETIVSLTDQEFDLVLSHFTTKYFRKHQFIVQADTIVTQNYFIVKGLTKSFHIDSAGKEWVLDFALDAHWITDVEAFYQHKEATLNIYCIEDCHTLSISNQNLEVLCTRVPKMEYYFRRKSIKDNTRLQRRILCLIRNNATDRYHDLITNNPQLVHRVPKALIASYLGVSRETLSRMMPVRL
jgi:CRP-like cAMP-binding protein